MNELEQQTAKEHSDSEAEIKELLGIDLDRMFAGVPGAGSHDAEVPAGVLGAVRVYDSGSDTFSLSEERFFLVGDGVSATWIAIMRGDSDFMRSYNHVAFQVHPGDLDAMRRAVDELGLECRPPRSRVEGEGQSVYFYDDDNHLFELHTGSLRDRLAVYVPAALSSHDAGN